MPRVLVFEPVGEVRTLIERMVTRLGYEPVAANRSSEALEVDAAIVEPAGAGALELVADLRKRDPDLPLIFASIEPQTDEARELRPVAFLVKPFHLDDLRGALERALGRAGA